jgi:hypothetical protein
MMIIVVLLDILKKQGTSMSLCHCRPINFTNANYIASCRRLPSHA